jgi:hypothetical protein
MEKQTKKAMYYDGQFEGPCPDRDPDFVWAPDSTTKNMFWWEEMVCCRPRFKQLPVMHRIIIDDVANHSYELRDEIWRAYSDWLFEREVLK